VNEPLRAPTSENCTQLVARPVEGESASQTMRCVSSPNVRAPRKPSLVRVPPRMDSCVDREVA